MRWPSQAGVSGGSAGDGDGPMANCMLPCTKLPATSLLPLVHCLLWDLNRKQHKVGGREVVVDQHCLWR